MIHQVLIVALMCSHALANSVTARNSAIPEQAVATDNSYYYQQYPQQYYGYNWNNLLNQKQDFGVGGDDLGSTGVTLGTIAIVAVVVVIILLAIPTILAVASLIYTGVATSDWMSVLPGGNDKNRSARSMTALKSLIDSENCIERISCAVGQRTMRRKRTHGDPTKNKLEDNDFEGHGKSSLMQRISRAFQSDNDCAAYKCSLFSYFS